MVAEIPAKIAYKTNSEKVHCNTVSNLSIKEIVQHLREDIISGENWCIAILKAMNMWSLPCEIYSDRIYNYLIDGEAFDWLLLAERLCEEVEELIPYEECIAFLFWGKTPLDLTVEEFRKLIGSIKYNSFLNYRYGIILEEALITVVEDETRKERHNLAINHEKGLEDEVYRRLYESEYDALLSEFRKEKQIRRLNTMSLGEHKEFLFWLFKYRLRKCERARFASDTRKALSYLTAMKKHCYYPPSYT